MLSATNLFTGRVLDSTSFRNVVLANLARDKAILVTEFVAHFCGTVTAAFEPARFLLAFGAETFSAVVTLFRAAFTVQRTWIGKLLFFVVGRILVLHLQRLAAAVFLTRESFDHFRIGDTTTAKHDVACFEFVSTSYASTIPATVYTKRNVASGTSVTGTTRKAEMIRDVAAFVVVIWSIHIC
jgi:hypothetical protein